MSTEQQPLLGEVSVGTHLNSRAHTVGAMGLELSVNGTTPPEPIPETESLEPQVENPEVPAQDSTVNPPEILRESM